jgi:hypothetical protein
VLTFGNGMYGQLGHGNTEKQSAPKLVTALQGQAVYLLACGNFHTVSILSKPSCASVLVIFCPLETMTHARCDVLLMLLIPNVSFIDCCYK